MRKISENAQHLYQMLYVYKETPGYVTWNEALKVSSTIWPSNRLNPQEFQYLSNLAARAGYLSGFAYPRRRTKKYKREHPDIVPSGFTSYRSISEKGRNFLATYESLQSHLKAIYPDNLEVGRLPPETVRMEILGKPRKTGKDSWSLPVRFIPQIPPQARIVTMIPRKD
jgi:hypothetical protein